MYRNCNAIACVDDPLEFALRRTSLPCILNTHSETIGGDTVSLSSREAWGKFQAWLLDVHPRARNQSAMLAALLDVKSLALPVARLQDAIWELGESPASEVIFKREDRFRRLLSDLRRNIAEYNRLTPGDGRLILVKQGRAGGTLSLGLTEPTQTEDDDETEQLLCDSHDVLAGTEVLAGVRWSESDVPPGECLRLAHWLTGDVRDSQSHHSDGPEWRGECLVRRGAGHEVERLARAALTEARDGPSRWRLLTLWGEAFDAVGGLSRAHSFLEQQFKEAKADDLGARDPQAYFRFARLLVRSIAQDADHCAQFEEHIAAFVEQAYGAGRRCDAHTLQAYQLHRMLSEAFEHDRPSLLTQAMRELRTLLEKTAGDPEPVQLHVRTTYWIGRARMTRDLTQTLQESRTILRDQIRGGNLLAAAMVQSYQAHLLCQAGEWDRATELSCPNICRRIHYVDRSGLIFPLRDFENTLRARNQDGVAEIQSALEHVRSILGAIVQDYASRMLCRRVIRELPVELPAAELRPLARIFPWAFLSDWRRLLIDSPPCRPF